MTKTIFTATVFSVFLIAGGAFAQQSNQGTPNSVHGSGDMMQDGPHASANPNADAETGPAAGSHQARMDACEKKWKEAERNGSAETTDRDTFVNSCMSAK